MQLGNMISRIDIVNNDKKSDEINRINLIDENVSGERNQIG